MDITTDYELECRGDDDFIVWINGGKDLKCFATLAAAQRYMRRLAREVALRRMTLDDLEDLSQTIRRSLDYADKTAETLREWLRRVEAEIEHKAGF